MQLATRRHHNKLKLARPSPAEMNMSLVLARPALEVTAAGNRARVAEALSAYMHIVAVGAWPPPWP